MKRRSFVKLTSISSAGIIISSCNSNTAENSIIENTNTSTIPLKPIVISTWKHGLEANKAAWEVLMKNGMALDAVEKGVRITESDPQNRSVGLGGLPDKEGNVTLDACIMNHQYDCGSVAFLQHIENPISVARKVMEKTPHVMLVGKGAYEFAIKEGFKKKNLLTPEAKIEWLKWKKSLINEKPAINNENHDTIGMLALDHKGNLSGACTTSGWAYKLHGRVGDSPIIGAGLFVDNKVGAACATGLGEAVIRICGSHTVVELMRQGYHPNEACRAAINRIKNTHKDITGVQVGFIAINKKGEVGGCSIYEGFNYAYKDINSEKLVDTNFDLKW